MKEIFAEDFFHFYSLSTVHSYDLYHIHFTSFSSYNGYKLNSDLTCFRRGSIAQSVEHCTSITEVMGSNPVGASELFLRFTTAKISFTFNIITVNIHLPSTCTVMSCVHCALYLLYALDHHHHPPASNVHSMCEPH